MSDNLAKLTGIHSIAAPIVFAVLYLPLLAWFARLSFGRPTYVFIVLSIFCLIRIAAFGVRTALAASESVGENLSVLIADQILFGVGFFGLLFSAYTLVLDRLLLANDSTTKRSGIISQITGNRRLFKIIMLTAVVLGIVGASEISGSDPTNGKTLRIVSTVIFLVLTVLVAYETFLLSVAELGEKTGYKTPPNSTIGAEYGSYILCVIALLLLVREAYSTATSHDTKIQNNEHLWYPLTALPEILAVILYATPGLVPPRRELPTEMN